MKTILTLLAGLLLASATSIMAGGTGEDCIDVVRDEWGNRAFKNVCNRPVEVEWNCGTYGPASNQISAFGRFGTQCRDGTTIRYATCVIPAGYRAATVQWNGQSGSRVDCTLYE